MSVTLTTDQFNELLNNMKSKKNNQEIDLTELKNKRTEALNFSDFMDIFDYISIVKILNVNTDDYIYDTIIHNLDKLEKDEYPFIHINGTFYFKNNNEWSKSTDFIKEIVFKVFSFVSKQLINWKHNDEKLAITSRFYNPERYPLAKLRNTLLNRLTKNVKINYF